jgi:hypothetical protein
MKPEPEQRPSALPFIDDEPFYEEVAKEFETDSMKPGLWTKALAEADGEQDRVKPIYIRLRVAQLLAAKEAELRSLQRLENERIKAEEEAAKKEAAREEAARQEAARKEAELIELQRLEDERIIAEEEVARLEAAREEAERIEAAREVAAEKERKREEARLDLVEKEKRRRASTDLKHWEKGGAERSDTEKFITSFFLTLVVIGIGIAIVQCISNLD